MYKISLILVALMLLGSLANYSLDPVSVVSPTSAESDAQKPNWLKISQCSP